MNGWHTSIEKLLSEIASEALVREKLHRSSHYRYKRLLHCFQLPLITVSAINAAAQFLSKSFPQYESTIITCTGSTSVFVSVVTAIMSYLKIGENAANHAKAQSEWSSLYNSIRAQLMLSPTLRTEGSEFLQKIRADFKQLTEFSPLPSQKSITTVKKAIEKSRHPNFKVPATMNGFSGIDVYHDGDSDFEENSV